MGIIWKKSLPASPIPLDSDRICGVQLHLTKHIISVLSVYLPSTDHDIEEYKHYLNVLECAISALQSEGQVIVVGDYNAHLPTLQHNNANTQGQLLADLLHCYNLFPVSCSNIATEPKYTYFSGQTTTTVDYILINPELAPSVNSCTTLAHAPLNVSDHLPISISICTPYTNSLHCEPSHSTINWSKTSEDGSIEHYSRQVRCAIAPQLNNTLLSINEVDAEIQHVAGILKDAAFDCLPQIKQKTIRNLSQTQTSLLSVSRAKQPGNDGRMLVGRDLVVCGWR